MAENMITIELVKKWGICEEYNVEATYSWIGEGKTVQEILDHDIPPVDKLWVLLRGKILGNRKLSAFIFFCRKQMAELENNILLAEHYRTNIQIIKDSKDIGSQFAEIRAAKASLDARKTFINNTETKSEDLVGFTQKQVDFIREMQSW